MTGRRPRFFALAGMLTVAGCSHSPPLLPPPAAAAKPLDAEETRAAGDDQIEVSFASGSATLSADGGRRLDLAARLFRDVGPSRMFAIGHSDAQGDEFANILLSAERARAVKQGMVARGIPASQLYIQAVGESEPLSRSDLGAADNRRVVVKWQVN